MLLPGEKKICQQFTPLLFLFWQAGIWLCAALVSLSLWLLSSAAEVRESYHGRRDRADFVIQYLHYFGFLHERGVFKKHVHINF